MAGLWATKPVEELISEERGRLKRALGPGSLIALGLGAMIGSGIFVLMGIAAGRYAGPAVVLSFAFAALGCLLTGLCYAEFASMIPVAGSAYTYGYATQGELFAWVIGWDLVLEYGFGAATVASGWSGYVISFLGNFGLKLPPMIAGTPWDIFVYYRGHWEHMQHILPILKAAGIDPATLPHTHGLINLLASLIVLLVSGVLVVGIKESSSLSGAMVIVNICVLLAFVLIGAYYLAHHPALLSTNWSGFIPVNTGEFGRFGWSGILRAAALVFFAFIGIDAIATLSAESKNPKRDMLIGILGSLAICTVLYLVAAAMLISLVDYRNLDVLDPLAVAIESTGLHWARLLVTLGAVAGLGSTAMIMLLGQSRLLFSMSRDGLLPGLFVSIHPRFRTPHYSTMIAGLFVSVLAAVLPMDVLIEMVSIGTLLAFSSVCAAVLLSRRRRPHLFRPFRTPWVPTVPIMGIVIALAMMLSLTQTTWIRLGAWFVIGITIYFGYGRRHSHLRQRDAPAPWALDGEVVGLGGGPNSPEKEFLGTILRGLFRALVIILGAAALLSAISAFFPVVERRFDVIAAVLSIAAMIVGIGYAIAPGLKSLWLLRRQQDQIQNAADLSDEERGIWELIERLRKASDGPESKE
jgi:APA family basic amino acid/polyamine antiporter